MYDICNEYVTYVRFFNGHGMYYSEFLWTLQLALPLVSVQGTADLWSTMCAHSEVGNFRKNGPEQIQVPIQVGLLYLIQPPLWGQQVQSGINYVGPQVHCFEQKAGFDFCTSNTKCRRLISKLFTLKCITIWSLWSFQYSQLVSKNYSSTTW